jgi:hypothetical protein
MSRGRWARAGRVALRYLYAIASLAEMGTGIADFSLGRGITAAVPMSLVFLLLINWDLVLERASLLEQRAYHAERRLDLLESAWRSIGRLNGGSGPHVQSGQYPTP